LFYSYTIGRTTEEIGGIKMGEKIKRFITVVFKLVGIVCTVLVGILIVCGLPLDEIKEKIQKKFELTKL